MLTDREKKSLPKLQQKYASIRRPLRTLMSCEDSREVVRTNFKKYYFSKPTAKQLRLLKALHYDEEPRSRIEASQILHELTLLAHHEAAEQKQFEKENPVVALVFDDIGGTSISEDDVRCLLDFAEVDCEGSPGIGVRFKSDDASQPQKELLLQYDSLVSRDCDILRLAETSRMFSPTKKGASR